MRRRDVSGAGWGSGQRGAMSAPEPSVLNALKGFTESADKWPGPRAVKIFVASVYNGEYLRVWGLYFLFLLRSKLGMKAGSFQALENSLYSKKSWEHKWILVSTSVDSDISAIYVRIRASAKTSTVQSRVPAPWSILNNCMNSAKLASKSERDWLSKIIVTTITCFMHYNI